MHANRLKRPILAPLWAGGLSFSKCHAEKRVKYDISLIQIWTGEEFGRGARLWTHGYDFYTPTKPIISHDYSPTANQKKWHHDANEYKASEARLMTVLQMQGSDQSIEAHARIQEYGLGNKRTLEQYGLFCGLDICHSKAHFDYCVDYEWVPYEWTEREIHNIRLFGKTRRNTTDTHIHTHIHSGRATAVISMVLVSVIALVLCMLKSFQQSKKEDQPKLIIAGKES